MTLHEASAVFLIIGGVLLGPIERQNYATGRSYYSECVREYSQGRGVLSLTNEQHDECVVAEEENPSTLKIHLETTAETCERVMREIGADKRWTRTMRPWAEDVDGYELSIGGPRVLCIPAPSGLRR